MVGVGVPVIWLIRNSRGMVETARYTVVRTDGAFEIRDYPELTVATTPMEEGGMDGSFGRLFRFITGKNERSESIPMTTPVLIAQGGDRGTMSFVMPEAMVRRGVPQPAQPEVHLGKLEAERMVAMRFHGDRSEKTEHAAIEKLNRWMSEQKITAEGEPIFAYYDPPWTPAFLRRNEVLVKMAIE